MKYYALLTILVTLPLLSFGQTNTVTAEPTSIEIDGYAAQVNDRVITRSEVMEALAPILPELYRAYQGTQLEEEREKAFKHIRQELIERALIMEAFKAKGGYIPDQLANDEIKRIISTRFKGDKALFEQALTDQKKTRAEYMDMIREQIAVRWTINEEVNLRARVTPEEILQAYHDNKETYLIPEKVKYSLIVLNKGETPEDRSVKKTEAAKIRQRLLAGADFAETARKSSEGSRAADGGSFPWMQPKDVRLELQDALNELPAGDISDIIETDTQLYIIKVEARQKSSHKPFDEVRRDLETALESAERQRLRERWIERLMDSNYVVIYD